MNALAPDPRLSIGGNNPPEETPFEAIKVHIDDLYAEAKGFLDGEPIATQGQADAVSNLLNMIREAEKVADAERVKENEPFDTGKAQVQARYAPLIGKTKTVTGKTVLAADACKAALAPWLLKLDTERREREAAARWAADEAAAKAAAAFRAADTSDLDAREAANALAEDARKAEQAAKAAANAKATVKGDGRAVGLRSTWTPTLSDPRAALNHYAVAQPERIKTLLLDLAAEDVRAGKRTIPGFTVTEGHTVV